MSRRLTSKSSEMMRLGIAALVVGLLAVCPLAAQDFIYDPIAADPPLHSKVSSSGTSSIQRTGPSGGVRAIQQVQFEEEIAPGAAYNTSPYNTAPYNAGPYDSAPYGATPDGAMSYDDGYPPAPDFGGGPQYGGPMYGGQFYGDPNCYGPTGPAGCDPCSAISPDRQCYMERHFGPGAIAHADWIMRFSPSCCCIDNNFYAPVAPPSPCKPLGGDSPLGESSTGWFHRKPPADPCGDPDCPEPAPVPGKSPNPCMAGTGWYPNGSPCYLGNCFEKQGGCCGNFLSWVWKHNTAQYMWENFHLIGGPQGFKSPSDLFQDGNFGMHEGLNWGMPVWDDIGLGYQKGFMFTQNNWNGTTGPGLANHYRNQFFVTAGLFHRPLRGVGLQGGLAFDYLTDSYYTRINLTQLRGEVSYLLPGHNEIGFWATQRLDVSSPIPLPYLTLQPTSFRATNQYNFFVRRNFASGASARVWAGFTSGGDGLVGGDGTYYLSDRWAVNSAFNYLIPKNNPSVPATVREDLALTISLMWWPGYRTPASRYNPYRQLFNVADNTTFLVQPK